MTDLELKGGPGPRRVKEDAPRSWKDRQKGHEGTGTCDLKSTTTAMGPEGLWLSVLGKQRKSLRHGAGCQRAGQYWERS